MSRGVVAHLRHHWRIYTALVAGAATWGVAGLFLPASLRLSLAGDVAFALYLVLMWANMLPLKPDRLRLRSDYEDEGAWIIFIITVAAVALSVGNLFMILNSGAPSAPLLALAFSGVPLGWLTLHIVMAAHYSHIFYSNAKSGRARVDAGGLDFPNTKEPTYWDFLYYSFVVGMTAQTSDTQVTSTRMRKLTLFHGLLSFLYNTVLIALAVNIVVNFVK